MNISKFTQKSQEAVQLAQKIALENGNQQIDQEHLAAALLEVEDSLIANLVTKMGIQKEAFAGEINTLIGKLPKISGASGQEYLTALMSILAIEDMGLIKVELESAPPRLIRTALKKADPDRSAVWRRLQSWREGNLD